MELDNIIIMKCGTHATEKIEDIYNRKKQEEINNGYFCWGYGGTLCHPLNQVQPFCNNKKVYLLLTPTTSELNNYPQRAEYYSKDKVNWQPISSTVNVLGSKFAIVAKNLKQCDFELDLNNYEIAIGNSEEKNLALYLNGRVDKACARKIKKNSTETNERKIKITMIAELEYPYSIFVK